MTDQNLLDWLVDEAEETLDAEDLLMLYELSWTVRGRYPGMKPHEIAAACRSAYTVIRNRHPELRLVWVTWPHKEFAGEAGDVQLSFEIEDDDAERPLLALAPGAA